MQNRSSRFGLYKDLLSTSKYFKLVCGAGNEDKEVVNYLTFIYTLAGCAGFDISANTEVVRAAKNGINEALKKALIDTNKNGNPDEAEIDEDEDGKTDVIAYLPKEVVWNDYEYTIDNLPTFKYFSIKLIGTGTNQAQPPRVKNLRVVAIA